MRNSITAPGFSCATSVRAAWLRERKNILDIVAAYVGGLGSTSIETALADDCQHEIVNGDGGGIRCRRCAGWFCF